MLYHSDRHRSMFCWVMFKNIVLVGDFNSHDFKISKVVVENKKKTHESFGVCGYTIKT